MVIGHTTMVVSFKSRIMGDRWGFMDGLGSSGTGMQNNKIWKEVRLIPGYKENLTCYPLKNVFY